MSDDFATRVEVDGIGRRINRAEVAHAALQAELRQRVAGLESWTQDQEQGLKELNTEMHVLDVKVSGMKDEIVSKLSTRIGIMIAVMTAVLGIIAFFK